MQLLLYPLLVFIISFIVQLLLIEKKRKNKNARERDINIEKEHKWNRKRLIKIIIASIISFVISFVILCEFGFSIYPILAFIASFIVQLILIESQENKTKSKKDISIEKNNKYDKKRTIKIVMASTLSFFLAVITLYGLTFAVLTSLQEGR